MKSHINNWWFYKAVTVCMMCVQWYMYHFHFDREIPGHLPRVNSLYLPLCECRGWNSGHQGCGTSSFSHISLAQGMITHSLTSYIKNNNNKTFLACLNSVLRWPIHLFSLLRLNLVISWCSTNTYEIHSAFQTALYFGEVTWSSKGLHSIRGHGKYANSLL